MKRIKYWIRNYFGFSQTETNGFVILMLVMIGFLVMPFIYARISFHQIDENLAGDKKLFDNLITQIEKNQITSEQENKFDENLSTIDDQSTIALFDFDPNSLSVEQWMNLGIKKNLAERIQNYSQKGGKFRVKKDLLKIYGFPQEVYQRLEDYIQLPETLADNVPFYADENKTYAKKDFSHNKLQAFDINLADSTQLKAVKGIGSKLSQRIIKYRDRLGGFVHTNQLKEIYGLDSLTISELSKYGYVDANLVKKIYINKVSLEELQHPYLPKNVAYTIINYRQQHGTFTSAKDLLKIKIISPELLDKLTPYLNYEK